MPLDMVLRNWTYVEADFLRFYGVEHPLRLSWRRFRTYLVGLPPTSTYSLVTAEERKLETMSAAERMDYYRNKHSSNTTLTTDDFVQMVKSGD